MIRSLSRLTSVICTLATASTLAVLAVPTAATPEPMTVLRHAAELRFDVPHHAVAITDRVVVPDGVVELRLGAGFELHELVLERDGLRRAPVHDPVRADPETGELILDLAQLGERAGWTLVLTYGGTFHQPTDAVTFSREKVGGEITATISEEGIYLSSGAGWLPGAEGLFAAHVIACDTPAGWETVTQGVRTRHETAGDRLLTTWEASYPSDGIVLVAGPYTVSEATAGGGEHVAIYTFLREPDEHLRDLYLERTRHYIAMYEEMLGPYPYGKFATVENWFPTGYGMPGWTLLGGQVLRLPFIPYTSFGHEICHNWWGNSVFVDVEQGNWCEGLTTYCADYHYKAEESEAAAREYRRNLLKDYAAYVRDPHQDFPLREFKSRHSGATRAVGYGKSMYVFHMVERALGREAFLAALRDVVRDFTFRPAGWGDFFAAFAAHGGGDLAAFKAQWIDRTGAPVLRLEEARRDGDDVVFALSQGAPPYVLDVPVVVGAGNILSEHVVRLENMRQEFRLAAPGATRLQVDPDHHLFRRLDPREIEPTVSQVLAEAAPVFSLPAGAPAYAAPGEAFARAMVETELINLFPDGTLPVDVAREHAASAFLFRTDGDDLEGYLPAGLTVAGTLVVLEGKRYSLDEYDLVYTVADPYHVGVTDLVVLTRAPERLEGLARRIGHYGKYSWLLLPAGRGPVLKGNWTPAAAPLSVDLEG